MDQVKVGDTIRIDYMDDCGYDTVANSYIGKTGKVTFIDDRSYIHGDWGGLSLIPNVDKFTIINND